MVHVDNMGTTSPMLSRAMAAFSACVAMPALALTPGYHLIGVAPGRSYSQAFGVSADGRVVAGFSSMLGSYPGFVWSEASGRNDFGLQAGMPITTATAAISPDGTTVAGITESPTNAGVPFRWSASAGLQTLGTLYGGNDSQTRAYALSGDGSIVVGASKPFWDGTTGQAFRWTQATGMVGIGYPTAGGIYSEATGISRDGSMIVGYGIGGGGGSTSFTWTQAQGMRVLPALPLGPGSQATALGMNFDGSYIAGRCEAASVSSTAVLWHNGVAQGLGVPNGWTKSVATDVSDDGQIVVGTLGTFAVTVPAVWTATSGWATLHDYLASQGMPVPAGWTLLESFSMSADGRTFVGLVSAPGLGEAISITVPSPGIATTLAVCAAFVAQRRRRERRRASQVM